MTPDPRGWIWSPSLHLWIGRWEGTYLRDPTTWLRFYDPARPTGLDLPRERQKQQQAERKQRAEAAEQRAAAAEAELARLQAELARLRGRSPRNEESVPGLTSPPGGC